MGSLSARPLNEHPSDGVTNDDGQVKRVSAQGPRQREGKVRSTRRATAAATIVFSFAA